MRPDFLCVYPQTLTVLACRSAKAVLHKLLPIPYQQLCLSDLFRIAAMLQVGAQLRSAINRLIDPPHSKHRTFIRVEEAADRASPGRYLRYPSDSRSLSTALQPARSQRSHAEIMRLLLQPSTDWRGSSCGVRWSRCRRHRRGYDAVKRAATLCLPHILHGDTVDRGCSYL